MRSSADDNKQPDKTVTIKAVGWVARVPRSPSLQLENKEESRFQNDHQIVGLLGEGAYSKVYLVETKLNGKQYAIKVIEIGKSTTEEEAWQEAEIHHRVQKHKNIVVYVDSWIETPTGVTGQQEIIVSEKMFYIQMGYIKGTSLLSQIEIGMEPDSIWTILKQLAQVLDYLHGKGIAHCDLHAGNILIDDQGRVKIIDFGQAKRLESSSEEDRAIVMAQDITSFACIAFDLHYGPFKSSSERKKKLQEIERRSITSSEFPEGAFPSEEHVVESLIKQDYGNLREPQANKIEPEDILSESENFFEDNGTTAAKDDALSMGLFALGYLVLICAIDRSLELATCCFFILLTMIAFLYISVGWRFICETIHTIIDRKPEFEAAYRTICKVVSRVTTLSI